MPCDAPSAVHPALGTLIDDDTLELVEVLGVGGYGVVYRAEDTCSSSPKSYAVKCLLHRTTQSARQRQIHIREVALHQIASAHPNVVTLHRVIEDNNCTYIIMDYAPDHDLFHQILHSCRYLGNDYLVKHVFLQLLDAVEYCHSLGIYHRDLKPENILCYDDGLRVAITDFGLATTDKVSEEFRTGSVYHMSPECQGGEFAPTGSYSPMFNDIWSLGIILLNLATGRNPWKSASASDPTFQAYLRDPLDFLPTVLPISQEVNAILTRMLEVNWNDRMTLPELRQALEDVDSFYSDGVIFEGSMARCPWEAGMEIDSDTSSTKHSPIKSQVAELKSHWSQESFSSDIIFASHSAMDSPWVDYSPFKAAAYPVGSDDNCHSTGEECCELFTRPHTPPSLQSPCASVESGPSYPTTPNSFDLTFGGRAVLPQRKPLLIDTSCARPRYLQRANSLASISSGSSSIMQTAVEFPSDDYGTDAVFGHSIPHPSMVAQSVHLGDSGFAEDKEMASPTVWDCSVSEASAPSMYSSTKNSYTTTHISFDHRSSAPSPEPFHWSEESQHSLSLYVKNAADITLAPTRPVLSPTKRSLETKLKATLFTPLKFFPRHSSWSRSRSHSPTPSRSLAFQEVEARPVEPLSSFTLCPAPVAHQAFSNHGLWPDFPPSKIPRLANPLPESSCRKSAAAARPRHWFLPSKLSIFSAAAS